MNSNQTVSTAVGRLFSAGVAGADVVDRDLHIGRDRVVSVVLVDIDGRLTFVLSAETCAQDALLFTLDALAFGKTHLPALARHSAHPRLRAELAPAVWLVARAIDGEARARLAGLDARRVRVFELLSLSSQRGASEYLSEVALERGGDAEHAASLDFGFLDRLTAQARPFGESIVERVRHLDEHVEASGSATELEWRVGSELIAGVVAESGSLHGHVPGIEEHVAIEDSEALERFLEAVVQRYLGVARVSFSDPAHVDHSEPLLTAEELAAFDPAR